ncbi:MAG: bifunctional phosphoribosyl-AMP cyclohydrolase/phosphoribosyl-ATP diphosphatase HisIE [Bacteroidota bacterium]
MEPDFSKSPDGLIPAIVQDSRTGKVLMLGYMNAEAFERTKSGKRVTFFSRSRRRLWTKGEESGNYLNVISILSDCDRDALLVKAIPQGPVCHTGADTCWNEANAREDFLGLLEEIIAGRKRDPADGSYTSSLFKSGINKIVQKVGEEATELVIEAKDNDMEKFRNEAADLLFHYLVLLQAKDVRLDEVVEVLRSRRK